MTEPIFLDSIISDDSLVCSNTHIELQDNFCSMDNNNESEICFSSTELLNDSIDTEQKIQNSNAEQRIQNSILITSGLLQVADQGVLSENEDLTVYENLDSQTLQNLLQLSRSSRNSNFHICKMQTTPISSESQTTRVVGLSSSGSFSRIKNRVNRSKSETRIEQSGSTKPLFRSFSDTLAKLKNKNFLYPRPRNAVITEAHYSNSTTIDQFKKNQSELLKDVSPSGIQEIHSFRSIIIDQGKKLDQDAASILAKLLNDLVKNREILSDSSQKFPVVKSKNKFKDLIASSEAKNKVKDTITTSIQEILSSFDEIPSVIGTMDTFTNLELLKEIYSHPYLLDILYTIKKDNQDQKNRKKITNLIENCIFVQKGVQIDHVLPTLLRTALFGHYVESSNTRHNIEIDSNWCVFIPVHKNKNDQIQFNLNTLRTGGMAASVLSQFTRYTSLRDDLHYLRDNGLLGDGFRITLHKTNLTSDEKENFLRSFMNSFEFVIQHAQEAMEMKYGIKELGSLVPESYFIILADVNIRFQRLFLVLNKIQNGEAKNIPPIDTVRQGLLAVAQHKNTILYLIDQIVEVHKLKDLKDLKDFEKIKQKSQDAKDALENDFKKNILYIVKKLLDIENHPLSTPNKLKKSFSMLNGTELNDKMKIKEAKQDFFDNLKETSTYLSNISDIPEWSKQPEVVIRQLVQILSKVRYENDLYKYFGHSSLYMSCFKILQSEKSIDAVTP